MRFECIKVYDRCPDIGTIAKRSSVNYGMFWCKVNLPHPWELILQSTHYFMSDTEHWKQIN